MIGSQCSCNLPYGIPEKADGTLVGREQLIAPIATHLNILVPPPYALLRRVSKTTWCPRPAVAVVAGLQDARLLPRPVVILLPMCRHGIVGIHALLVQSYQLLRRQLKVVSNQSSNLPLSHREEPNGMFVGREQFVAPIATHLHVPITTVRPIAEGVKAVVGGSQGGVAVPLPSASSTSAKLQLRCSPHPR